MPNQVGEVKEGDLFRVETIDWTAGQIKDNDSAEDMKKVDLTQVCPRLAFLRSAWHILRQSISRATGAQASQALKLVSSILLNIASSTCIVFAQIRAWRSSTGFQQIIHFRPIDYPWQLLPQLTQLHAARTCLSLPFEIVYTCKRQCTAARAMLIWFLPQPQTMLRSL